LGIGTTSPSDLVQTSTSANTAKGIRVTNTNSGTSTYASIYFGGATSETDSIIAGLGDSTTAYGGARSMVLGTNQATPVAFITGGTERMRIDGIGAVTMPYQPAFLAQPASTQENIAINTGVTVVLGTEVFDQNADFASNTFTAPVDGKYQLNAFTRLQDWDVDATYYQFSIVTSNRIYYNSWDAKINSVDLIFITLSLSVLADMDAGDTAYLRIQQSGGTSQTDIHEETTFSGYLAC
jgi:hypothetical protein